MEEKITQAIVISLAFLAMDVTDVADDGFLL
jgi:hypothetical protein